MRRGAVIMAGAMVVLGLATVTAGSASAAPSPGVCNGGSILGGVYTSLTINGTCFLDSGNVIVTGNVTVKSGDILFADYSGSDLQVKGNVVVQSNAALILGCNPNSFPCYNNPYGTTHDSIGGKLTSNGGVELIIHNTNVKGDVSFTNGGALCSFGDYSTFEDSNFGGNVTINKVLTCWMGFIRNQVVGTVTYNNNATADLDGNEIVTNKIGGSLKCQGNNPPPQAGDSGGGPNLVAGTRTGQCTSTSLP